MSVTPVWHLVELAEEDACPDCGGHPELCDCDGSDPLGDDDDGDA